MSGPAGPCPWWCGGGARVRPVSVCDATFVGSTGRDVFSESEWARSTFAMCMSSPPTAWVGVRLLEVPEQPAGVEHVVRVERPLDVPHQVTVAAGPAPNG